MYPALYLLSSMHLSMRRASLRCLFVLIIVCLDRQTSASSCVHPCKKEDCVPLKNLKCRSSSLVLDHCGCCQRCPNRHGQMCNGPDNVFGSCDKGLYCVNVTKEKIGKCGTLLEALRWSNLVAGMDRCIESANYKEKMRTVGRWAVSCYMRGGPNIYCEIDFKDDVSKCCLHPNDCNPDEEKYEFYASMPLVLEIKEKHAPF